MDKTEFKIAMRIPPHPSEHTLKLCLSQVVAVSRIDGEDAGAGVGIGEIGALEALHAHQQRRPAMPLLPGAAGAATALTRAHHTVESAIWLA